jgi:myo-inositol-1-phosphate synthase
MFINGQDDTKTGIIRIKGRNWAGQPVDLEARLEVNDSANAAGVLVDMVRFAKSAWERGIVGLLDPVCAFYSKHPPKEIADEEALGTLRQWAQASAAARG